MLVLVLVLAAIGAAALAGLIALFVFFLLLLPLLLMLTVAALILGRQRFHIDVVRGHRTPLEHDDRPDHAEGNH